MHEPEQGYRLLRNILLAIVAATPNTQQTELTPVVAVVDPRSLSCSVMSPTLKKATP